MTLKEDLSKRHRNFGNNTGTTNYDSLQGSYWPDQRTVIIDHYDFPAGAIKWPHEGIR